MEKEIGETKIQMEDRLSVHTEVEVKGIKYLAALDELSTMLSNPFTGKKELYETMIFPISDKGEVLYGREAYSERYETAIEAASHYKTILSDLCRGCDFSEITPKDLKFEIVDEDKSFEGLKLKDGDVIVRNAQDEAILIGKPDRKEFESREFINKDNETLKHELYEVHVYPYIMDGYGKTLGEDGKSIWKAQILDNHNSPARSMYEKAYDYHMNRLATKKSREVLMDKAKDYLLTKAVMTFVGKVGKRAVMMDLYKPTGKAGVYTHEEIMYKGPELWKKTRKTPVTITWDEFKEKTAHELEQIKLAKAMKLLYYPPNTTIILPQKMKEMEQDQSLHSMNLEKKKALLADKSTKRPGIHRKSNGKGMEI